MRLSFERGGMRRLRAGLVNLLPGGLGTPPYRHYDPRARSFAGRPEQSGSQARPEVSAAS